MWKDNKNVKQLTEDDVRPLLLSLKKLGTKMVLMSGGEALLHPNFFKLCALFKKQGLYITLLSTGILLKKNADNLLKYVDEIIVSLDGDASTHDAIRNVGGAFSLLSEGIAYLKKCKPGYRISARTVIHRLNYKVWPSIIETAKTIGVDSISFLPADVSSQAFNRETLWSADRQQEIAISKEEIPDLQKVLDEIINRFPSEFKEHFIAESPAKLQQIVQYYQAVSGLCAFPKIRCNAPWVSTVIEPDGSVRPCFFHNVIGSIKRNSLEQIINSKESVLFRKKLDMATDPICKRCVCHLNLPPQKNPVVVN